MYKILIVDDEPIILSGIKFMLDWQKYDARVMATARNGEEALSIIRKEQPDIVISDVKMPIMDGLELLRKVSEEYPEIVVLMLTSFSEFRLAQQALKYNALDYILKTELDEEVLKNALLRAEKESQARSMLLRAKSRDAITEEHQNAEAEIISHILQLRSIPRESILLLERQGLLSSYAIIAFAVTYPTPSFDAEFSPEDLDRLFEWESDMMDKIVASAFPSYYHVTPVAGKKNMCIYFLSGIDPLSWKRNITAIQQKLNDASTLVTGLTTELLHTEIYTSPSLLAKARLAIEDEADSRYLGYECHEFVSLNLDEVFPKIERDIRKKDMLSLNNALVRVCSSIAEKPHRKSQALFALKGVEAAIRSGFLSIQVNEAKLITDLFLQLPYLGKRKDFISFLETLRTALTEAISASSGPKGEIIDKARKYILENVGSPITLADVASAACVSPGYMSALWNRHTGSSLSDFINRCKVDRAIELMNGGADRINEIASSLGFENIYYFSRIFRKVTGETPTGYIRQLHTEHSS